MYGLLKFSGNLNPIVASGANLLFNKEIFLEIDSIESHIDTSSGDDAFLLQDFKLNDQKIELAFKKGRTGETYNIGGRNERNNLYIVDAICSILNKKLPKKEGKYQDLITFVKDRPGHDLRYAIDATKLKNELGRKPSLQFEEGLSKTIDWYLNNEEWLNEVTSGNYQKYYDQQYGEKN